MKPNHTWMLFKRELAYFARFFFFPAIFAAEIVLFSQFERMDLGILAGLLVLFSGIAIFWSYGFLFQDGRFGMRMCGQRIGLRTLEFPFSLAIDRRALFRARTALFLASAAIPLVTFVVASFWHPDRMIEVYPTAASPGTAIQSYYVSHYPGATVQITDTKPPRPGTPQRPVPRKISILLPRARIDLAWVALWAGAAAAVFYQALMLATLPFRWCQRLLPICCGVLAPTGVLAFSAYTIAEAVRSRASANQPPFLDRALTLIAQHSLAAFLVAALLIACTLPISRGRFARQEVLI
jgi:hypothetical protein